MAISVTMPRLGESVSEGTVTRWLKREGERVEADEPLLEVSTDKVDTEIPAPASGVLRRIAVAEDETVEVGVELAVIDDGEADPGAQPVPGSVTEPAAAAAPAPATHPAPPVEPDPAPAATAAAPPGGEPPTGSPVPAQPPVPAATAGGGETGTPVDASTGTDPYVTPLVRRLAADHGVDLNVVRGTGVGGRIRKQDVLDAATNPPSVTANAPLAPTNAPLATAAPTPPAARPTVPAPAVPAPAAALRGRTEKLSRLRTVIAERMVESLRVSAQLTTVVEVDVTRVAVLRAQARAAFEARAGVKLTMLPFFALAAVEALKSHPNLNASVDQAAGTITYHDAEHLGIAVDTERGLLVPVLHDAGDLNLAGLARRIADLAERTRRNAVSPDELGGGTFTLTNTGSRGALFDTPIINQPQVGVLGTGVVVKRPVVIDDPVMGAVVAIRSMVHLALTYDHRVVDGADAARFLTTVKNRLQDGAFEAELGL